MPRAGAPPRCFCLWLLTGVVSVTLLWQTARSPLWYPASYVLRWALHFLPISDEDLDRHVAELILKEAKKKAEQYDKQGIRAYLPQYVHFPFPSVPTIND
jgi:hypothetical protein